MQLTTLAGGYRDAGKVDRALPLLEETLALMKVKLGPDHPSTLDEAMGVSRATAFREWAYARSWLATALASAR